MDTQLSFIEKCVLAAYREFFEENYIPSSGQSSTDSHIIVQKMCYLLSRRNCDLVETGFVWNTFGPFSVRLQEILRHIDSKGNELQEFYRDYRRGDILDNEILGEIKDLRTNLKIPNGNSRRWIELLASLSFLAHSELPTSDYSYIIMELKRRKTSYSDDKENEMAWKLLNSAGIAY